MYVYVYIYIYIHIQSHVYVYTYVLYTYIWIYTQMMYIMYTICRDIEWFPSENATEHPLGSQRGV